MIETGVPERQKGKGGGGGAAFSNGTFDTVRTVITIYIADILSSN